MRCAVATSHEKDALAAAGEVSARLRAELGDGVVDLCLVFATMHHRDSLGAIAARVRAGLAPQQLLGCNAEELLASDQRASSDGREVALTVFAARLPETVLEAYHVTFRSDGATARLVGLPVEAIHGRRDAGILVLGEPFSFPMDALLSIANERAPGIPLIGGMASGGWSAGQNRLVLNEHEFAEGALLLIVSGRTELRALVAQGCRPVGRHFVITRGADNVIQELGGRSAVTCLREVLDAASEHDRALFRAALHIGRVIDEYKSTFQPGDFLVRSVIRIDSRDGSIAINDVIRRGQTVQFHVRDPASASEDLHLLLQAEASRAPPTPGAAVLFSCNGRGARMFDDPDHDLLAIRSHFPGVPVVGVRAAGEIGPVGGQNFLHGFTASIALFSTRA